MIYIYTNTKCTEVLEKFIKYPYVIQAQKADAIILLYSTSLRHLPTFPIYVFYSI